VTETTSTSDRTYRAPATFQYPAVAVRVRRGGALESTHRVHVTIADARAGVLAALGDPELPAFFRSSAKPFQAMPLVRTHAASLGMSDEEIAVTTGSHTAMPQHLSIVRGLLAKVGLTENALQCGFQWPRDPTSEAEVRAGAPRSPIYNNCSGKHAGMLALAVTHGWSPEGYLDSNHPAQALIVDTVAEWTGPVGGPRVLGIDGCSAPTMSLPVRAIAESYARFSAADVEPAAERIRRCMTTHPLLVAGEGRLDTVLMRVAGGAVVCKVGAEGVYAIGLVGRGVGIGFKVEDGAFRALPPAVIAVLLRLEVLDAEHVDALAIFARPEVRNHRDVLVGDMVAEVDLPADGWRAARGV
jgi:L-asparaginase II